MAGAAEIEIVTEWVGSVPPDVQCAEAHPAWVRATEILMRVAQRQASDSPTTEDNSDGNEEETYGE